MATITQINGDTDKIKDSDTIINTNFTNLNTELADKFDTTTDTVDALTDGVTYVKYSSTEKTKLSGIDENADVTDGANVDAAGAVMESDLLNISTGATDAGKPIKLDADGNIDATMINDADVSYNNISDVPSTFTPADHATEHQSGGGDVIKLDDLAAPDNNTDLNVSITAHGLCPKAPNVAGQYLNGVGAWATPAGAGDVIGPGSSVSGNLPSFGDTSGTLLADSGYDPTDFAVTAKGVTNGDSHNHIDGDGASLTEGALTLADNTTSNATVSAHGFLPRLSGTSTQFLNGAGAFSTPAGSTTRYLMVMAQDMIVPTTAPCSVLTQTETTNYDHNYKYLAFDSTTRENVNVNLIFPPNWNAGSITVKFYWTCLTTAGSGDVVWGVEGRTTGDDISMDGVIGTAIEVTDSKIANIDLHVSVETAEITLQHATAGELGLITIYRDPADAADTLGQDALLIGIQITYTVTS